MSHTPSPQLELLRYNQKHFEVYPQTSLESIKETLLNLIPDVVKNFSGYVADFISRDFKIKFDPISDKELNTIKGIHSEIYLELKDKAMPIPVYFTGTYLEYLSILEQMMEYNRAIEYNQDQFRKIVGSVLSDERSRHKDYSKEIHFFTELRAKREHIKENLSRLFTGKSTLVKAPYSQVLKRNKDWDEIIKKLDTLVKEINTFPVNKVEKNVSVLNEQLNIIVDQIKKGELEEAHPSLTKALSIGALEIAEQVEFLGLSIYQMDILNKVIHTAIEQFE